MHLLFPLLAFAQTTIPPADTGISFGWLLVKTVGAMVVIIALAFVVIRYVFPLFRWPAGRVGRSQIRIIDRAGVDHRKALVIVKVGKKTALLGVTDQNVNKIMDLEEKDLE